MLCPSKRESDDRMLEWLEVEFSCIRLSFWFSSSLLQYIYYYCFTFIRNLQYSVALQVDILFDPLSTNKDSSHVNAHEATLTRMRDSLGHDALEMDTLTTAPARPASTLSEKPLSRMSLARKDYLIGIALLLVVVILWTSSNFVTQVRFEYPEKTLLVNNIVCKSGFVRERIPETVPVCSMHFLVKDG
jgi:hypothetical protein